MSDPINIRTLAPGTRVALNWRSPVPAKKKIAVRCTFPAGGTAKLFALYLSDD